MIFEQLEKNGWTLPLHRQNVVTWQDAYAVVNLATSAALDKYVSEGKYTLKEYDFVERDAKEWRAGGSIEADAPESLLCSFENDDDLLTINDAAVEVEQAAALYRQKSNKARRIRMEARNALRKSTTTDYLSVIQPYLTRAEDI